MTCLRPLNEIPPSPVVLMNRWLLVLLLVNGGRDDSVTRGCGRCCCVYGCVASHFELLMRTKSTVQYTAVCHTCGILRGDYDANIKSG